MFAWLLAISGGARAEHAPIVFQSTDTPPLWSASLPENGAGGAILHLLSEAAGIKYRIEYLPVKRFRQSDATFLVGTPDILTGTHRRAIFPIGVFYAAIFSYKPHHDVNRFQGLAEMQGRTLGVLRGTLENKEYFVRNRINVEESDTAESLLRKLKKGRLDFCILVGATGRYMIRRLFPGEEGDFAVRILPGSERPLAIMIDLNVPEGREVAALYRQVLGKTLHSPAYLEIVEREFSGAVKHEYRIEQLDRFVQVYASTWSE
ncbi:MAG: hypothetical protein HYZ46_04760 [Nitrosomonadales bacterium]|nr:hypothetical protein [Nitrosomonadales bacterium]